MTEAAIQPSSNRDLILPEQTVGLSGHYDHDDISVPVCTLVQPTSKDKGEAGWYWFPDGSQYEELMTVVLHIAATRSLFADIDSGEGLICRSNDRVMGYTEKPNLVFNDEAETGTRYIQCQECPHFEDNQFERGVLCKKGYTLLLYETERRFPFLFFVRGTAVGIVKKRIVSPALARLQDTGTASPWLWKYQWLPKLRQDNFKYYVPDIYKKDEVDEEEQARYQMMAAQLRGATQQVGIEDEAVVSGVSSAPFQEPA